MSERVLPERASIAAEQVIEVALACWRLERVADALEQRGQALAIRHAAGRIRSMLTSTGLEIVDLAGRVYDAGLAPEVVELQEDASLPAGSSVIAETISPTLMWDGKLARRGQVIVKRGPAPASAGTEGTK